MGTPLGLHTPLWDCSHTFGVAHTPLGWGRCTQAEGDRIARRQGLPPATPSCSFAWPSHPIRVRLRVRATARTSVLAPLIRVTADACVAAGRQARRRAGARAHRRQPRGAGEAHRLVWPSCALCGRPPPRRFARAAEDSRLVDRESSGGIELCADACCLLCLLGACWVLAGCLLPANYGGHPTSARLRSCAN